MEKDLAGGNLGNVGKWDLDFKGGMLVAKLEANVGGVVNAGLVVEIGADAVLDAIAKAIPGSIDNAVIEVIKGALKA